jgi:iron complex outermembrane receptor protein
MSTNNKSGLGVFMLKPKFKAGITSLCFSTTAVALALLLPGMASAQAESEDLEEVVVTGSRIARDSFTSVSPIDVFDSEVLAVSGNTSIDEFLKDIPAFTGFQLGATTNNGGDGGKFVDMRGLDFKRTLVLINGRRSVGSFIGGSGDVGAVDLNTIPWHMIDRIEVLKDGASAIYGSDAITGVVNLILKTDFEGLEIHGDYGQSTEGDAENYGVAMVGGVGNDRGNFTATVGYDKQVEMLQGERAWAHDALYPLLTGSTFVATPSGSSNSRRIRATTTVGGVTLRNAIVAAGGPSSSNWIVDESTGVVRPFVATDVYNYAPVNALQTPYERWQTAANGHYQILDDTPVGTVDVYLEGMYTKRTSHQRLAPDASFAVDPAYPGAAGPQWNDLVPAENIWNPFGNTPSNPWGVSGYPVRLNRRFEESGGRLFVQSAETFRLVSGIRGELDLNDITWDLSYTYAENEMLEETKFYHRFDRWETIVTPSLCVADPACVAVTNAAGNSFNPFAPFGSITPGQMEYLSVGSLKDNFVNRMIQWQFNLTGNTESFLELAGGPVGWAAGYEYREEYAQYNPDEFVAEGLTTGGAGDPLEGKFHVNEFYGEILLPFLRDAEWARELDLEAAFRHSDYNTSAGNTTNYGVKVNWLPVDQARFRGTYATGFRAPNIVELVAGDTTTFPLVESYCEFGDRRSDLTATMRTNCTALGADTTDAGEYGFAWQSAYTYLAPPSGSLQPEESESYTVGLVLTPDMLPGVSVSVDYWNFEVDNYIDLTPFNDLLYACLNSTGLTGAACGPFTAAGSAAYAGGFPGDAQAALANQGLVETDGIDFQLDYTRELNGEFLLPAWVTGLNANFLATWVNSRTETFPLSGSRETVGTASSDFAVYPEWKFNTTIAFSGDNWVFAWDTNYMSSNDDRYRPPEITDDAVAESVWYHELRGSYTWNMITINLGIANLTDVDPPRFHSAFNANTEPGVYDVIGRRFWSSVKIAF